MKVAVNVTVEVDAEAWATEFGVERDEVRADVKVYMQGLCEQQVETLGLGAREKV